MCAGPIAGGAGPGAPVVVHTLLTKCMCTFDIVSRRGHGRLYYTALITPHERNVPRLFKIRSDSISSVPNVKARYEPNARIPTTSLITRSQLAISSW